MTSGALLSRRESSKIKAIFLALVLMLAFEGVTAVSEGNNAREVGSLTSHEVRCVFNNIPSGTDVRGACTNSRRIYRMINLKLT